MLPLTAPGPTTRQLSGLDPEGNYILSVVVKRTFDLSRSGRCTPADEQVPLVVDPMFEDPDASGLLAHDTDLFPFKLATDVVVVGAARVPRPVPCFEAEVRVGAARKPILVIGHRWCAIAATGELLFSPPEPIDSVPLRYDRAYGGRDLVAAAKYGDRFAIVAKFMDEGDQPESGRDFRYPRNPFGVGYLVDPTIEAVEHLRLPNLEDPGDPLTPEGLALGSWRRWPDMPLPQATGWVRHDWFPRVAFFGILPEFEPPTKPPLKEVVRGYVPADILTAGLQKDKFSFRWLNGASLGLQLPYLTGGEQIGLTHIHPAQARFEFRLPAERPKIWVDGRKGTLKETDPVIHTVVIEPDEHRVTVVWRGSAPALRPYLPEELEKMPLRVEWS